MVGHAIDTEQHVACLQVFVRLNGNVEDLSRDNRHDRDRIAHHKRGTLWGAPSHWDEQTEIEQHKDDKRRNLPEQIEADEVEPHQDEKQHKVDAEHSHDHWECSSECRAGTST